MWEYRRSVGFVIKTQSGMFGNHQSADYNIDGSHTGAAKPSTPKLEGESAGESAGETATRQTTLIKIAGGSVFGP